MHRLVLCVVIVGAAFAAFSLRVAQEHGATSGPAAVALDDRVPGVCRCEPLLPVTPATAVLTGVAPSLRTKAFLRFTRSLAIVVVVLFGCLVSGRVAGRFPFGPRRTGAAEAWRQRRVTRGPPMAAVTCA